MTSSAPSGSTSSTPGPTVTVAGLLLDLGGADGPLTRRLMAALRDGIRDGRLPAGTPLPPSRALAAELGCSRWVVTETYSQLVAEGYLSGTTGSATRVRQLGPVASSAAAPARAVESRPRYDLAPGIPDLAAFPRTRWADAYRQAVLGLQTDLLAGRSLLANTAARTTLTDYLRRTRQVREDPTQLSLSTGAGSGTAWLARLLVRLGHRRIAVEDPSWPGLRDAARRAGLDLVPIAVDGEGLCVAELDRHPDVRLVITTPAHQFPTGVAMAPERRLQLIDWAERVDGLIIEDDYDAEFRYDRRPVSSLQGMAPDRVALVGSVSKSLSPAVELGWVIMPQWLIMRILSDDLDRGTGPSAFTVEAFATMIDTGAYERHLRAMRNRYRRRREAVLQAITDLLPDCTPSGMAAGLHLMLRLPDGVDPAVVMHRARAVEVGVVDAARYRLSPASHPDLVIGFGNLRDGRERQAITLLAGAIHGS